MPESERPTLSDVTDAFWEYERALMANDLPVLDRLFLDDPATLRGDAAGILVGHEAISAFRNFSCRLFKTRLFVAVVTCSLNWTIAEITTWRRASRPIVVSTWSKKAST